MKEIRDIPNGVSLHFFARIMNMLLFMRYECIVTITAKKEGGAKVCKVDILPIEWYTIS